MASYKILHIGNVAQNAYVNSKVLSRYGVESDVVAYDLYHFACSPEWYEYQDDKIAEEILDNDFFPNFYRLGKSMPHIAENVAHGPVFHCLNYLTLRNEGARIARLALATLKYLRFKATVFKTTMPEAVFYPDEAFYGHLAEFQLSARLQANLAAGRLYESAYKALHHHLANLAGAVLAETASVPLPKAFLDSLTGRDADFDQWLSRCRRGHLLEALGLEFSTEDGEISEMHLAEFSEAEILSHVSYLGYWRKLMKHYDVCVFYGDAPIKAVFTDATNWCALEHGTIRSIPFEDTVYGRLTNYAFRKAPKVFITNTDYIAADFKMKFPKDKRVFLPHPFDESRTDALVAARGAPVQREKAVFLCPARQDWVANDKKWSKGNDRYFRAAAQLLADGETRFVLKCIRWGRDVTETDALIEELGICDHVEWIRPVSKLKLWHLISDCDCVIDQFVISVISGIGFETMALSKPLITKDDIVSNFVFFGEAAPILAADTVEQVASRMKSVIQDPDAAHMAGQAGLRWIREHHSAKRIAGLQLRAFFEVNSDLRKDPSSEYIDLPPRLGPV